jgi:hypothetical protein
MRFSLRFALITALLILVFTIAAASAVTISESPATLNPGGQITISISGLNDGSDFNLLIDGKLTVVPGSLATFQIENFNMPFSLKSGTVSASTHGTTSTAFSVRPSGGKTYSVMDNADANGNFVLPPQSYAVNSGLYDFLELEGIISPGTTLLTTEINLDGKKYGASNSQITFNVQGIQNGDVWVTVLVDNNQVMAPTEIVIGNGVSSSVQVTAVPTTTATPVVTAAPQSAETVTPTDTTALPEEAGTTAATPEMTSPETTSAPATQTTVPATTFYSPDQEASLTAQGVDYAALMMVNQTDVPDTWLMIGSPYTIVPASLTFDPPATLSFATPASGNDYAYFIGQYLNNEWTAVPSTPNGGTIDAEVNQAGTYGLMAYKPESTIQLAVTGTEQQTTPTPLVQETSTPRIASIALVAGAQEAGSPAASPTSTPLDIMVVTGAVAIGLALVARARR